MTARRCAAVAVAAAALTWASGGRANPVERSGGDSPLVRALTDELARAKQLHLPDMARPFFVSYAVTDNEQESVLAEYGGIVHHSVARGRSLDVDVRVGDRVIGGSNAENARSMPLSLDDDYAVLRRQIWLATDIAYKQAASELEQKRAAMARTASRKDRLPTMSVEKPHRLVIELPTAPADLASREAVVRAMSAVLREFPDIQEGVAELVGTRSRRIFVNTEGTVTSESQTLFRLEFKCRTQAADGMNLVNYATWVVPSLKELPSDKALVDAARRVASELTALREAPSIQDYTGPILFQGTAAPQVFDHLLSAHLSGTPPQNDPRFGVMAEDETLLAHKLGKRVLPRTFTVLDDPSVKGYRGRALVGGYHADDEGIPAQAVKLIENGMLRGFLMSRVPRKGFSNSNGHGRINYGGRAVGHVSNLFVSATGGARLSALERQALARARVEGEPYAVVVTLLDDPTVTRAYRDLGEVGSANAEGDVSLVPVLAYKLMPGGKRQLVRGVNISGLRVRSLKSIIGTGTVSRVHNFLRLGVPVSVVAPDLLFEEADVQQRQGENRRLPLIPPPMKARK